MMSRGAMRPDEMREWLAGRPRVLDGATGSELIRRGVAAAGRSWGVGALIEAPEAVRDLHADYVSAGAEALTAATFRVAPYSLAKQRLTERAAELAAAAVRLAREGACEAGREALVLASQTTLEDCYRPDLVPADDVLAREHDATARILAAAAPDALLLETFNTVREAAIAARAATATGLPVVVSFACRPEGRLLSGEDARAAAAAVSGPGVVGVGVNCTSVRDVMPALVRLAEGCSLALVAYANNAWSAADSPWLAAEPLTPEAYARWALAWAAAGARLVGGCCGTGPAHVAAVASRLR
jgi:S-methylmethionine-dependent homocysteine/selenocysteine methylase